MATKRVQREESDQTRCAGCSKSSLGTHEILYEMLSSDSIGMLAKRLNGF